MRSGYFFIIPTPKYITLSRNTRSNRASFDLIKVPVTRHFAESEISVYEKKKKTKKVMITAASSEIATLPSPYRRRTSGGDARSIVVFELQARN